ncbi:MAG TPA: hypothetical protein PKC85_10430 [Bacteroidia bacterium]|nr:hypothetical protein [Bacteroidia bacterium]HMU20246.1 hypothetical protein [Bacteroidia bacterium]
MLRIKFCGGLLYPSTSTRTNTFVGCFVNQDKILFSNTPSSYSTFTNAETGIGLLDATGYHLSNMRFHQTTTGISFARLNAALSSNLEITSNHFDRFGTAIKITAGISDQISGNHFNTVYENYYLQGNLNPADPLAQQNINFSGIEMYSSYGFSILDNYFYNLKNGVKITDSGPNGGRISTSSGLGNHFISCWRGVQCYKDNSRLDIHCNFHENNQTGAGFSVGWYVQDQLQNQGSFIPGQSNTKDPAGNEFYHFIPRKDIHAANAQSSFTYTHHDQNLSPQCKPIVNNTAWVILQNAPIGKGSTSCTEMQFMQSVSNDPVLAQQAIASTTDAELREQRIRHLIDWYEAAGMHEDAITYLESIADASARDILIRLYTQAGGFAEALLELQELQGCTDNDCINYIALQSILINWAQNGTSPVDMSTEEHDIISNVANSNTPSAPQVQSILAFVFNEEFIETPIDTGNGRYGYGVYETELGTETINFTLAPNPAKDNVTATFDLINETDEATITITDMQGRKVFDRKADIGQYEMQLDVSALSRASYVAELWINGTRVGRNKLLLIKN